MYKLAFCDNLLPNAAQERVGNELLASTVLLIEQFIPMRTVSQQNSTKVGTQFRIPFAPLEKTMDKRMALADRIRTILGDMDGPEYGKQARLARIAGCGRPVVNHWLSNEQQRITSEHAVRIASALGYRLEWLLEGKGPRKKTDTETVSDSSDSPMFIVHVSPMEMTLLSAYRAATAMGKSMIESICKSAPKEAPENNS